MRVEVPGRGTLTVKHVLLDYNGTLAVGGRLSEEVARLLRELAERVDVRVLSADTYGTVDRELERHGLSDSVRVERVSGDERRRKGEVVLELGPERCAAVGNGANDELMLRHAALGVCVLGPEGAYTGTLLAADVVVTRPEDALNLLLNPNALKATLRC
ncbi:HAD family hydrolase [Methanopyrus sp.]